MILGASGVGRVLLWWRWQATRTGHAEMGHGWAWTRVRAQAKADAFIAGEDNRPMTDDKPERSMWAAAGIVLGILAVAVVAVSLLLLLVGCSQSCEDKASDEYFDQQSNVNDNGGDVPGTWDMIEESDRYAAEKCS